MRKKKVIELGSLNTWFVSTDNGGDVCIVLREGDPDREDFYSISHGSCCVQAPLCCLKIWQNRDSFNVVNCEENQTITGLWLNDGSMLNVSFYIKNSEFDELLKDPILGKLCTRKELNKEDCCL